MSTLVLIQYLCDSERCDRTIRSSHWTALGAQASANADAKRAGWLSLVDGQKRKWHYCPDHREAATMRHVGYRDTAHMRNLEHGREWEKGAKA